ncbi:MAG: NADH:flavin oxidoreductase/NADH oxidase [Bacillales bacterium]|jgi:NADPH2 dehydrogenase|nr:NADH:flavin oxidoreductase/NADH oxidase [Bacillales bacterium]
MPKLFSSFKIKNLELKNRIVMAPMCMYSAVGDGIANDWHFVHYATRAVGGVGLIILEATGVTPNGRITNRDLGIWSDEHIPGLKRIVDEVHKHGSKIAIQLGHAGRKSEVSELESIAPSPIAFNENYRVPREMNLEDIQSAIKSFKEAAGRAVAAGFDAIEIHGAHGYLISEFLSPLTNIRTDEYGKDRSKFLKEVLQEIKSVLPKDYPIILRVSAEDYASAGNYPVDIAKLINEVKDSGIDIVDVSSGGVVHTRIDVFPGYQISHSETVRHETKLPTIAGGLITTPLMAEEILCNKRADLIFLGRVLLRDPYWTLHAAKELNYELEWPTQYERGR